MNKSMFAKTLWIVCVLSAAAPFTLNAAETKPNIVFILADDMYKQGEAVQLIRRQSGLFKAFSRQFRIAMD